MLAFVSLVVQILMLVILLCPLAAIYVFGLLISTGISIWRLIQHDYGGNSDGGANLKPAMDTLYSLALLQGVIFCYRFFFAVRKKAFVKEVIRKPYDKEELKVVSTYLRETRIGCEKDPSFARGRNLITHAVDLIGSKSPDDCLFGVKMLHLVIRIGEKSLKKERVEDQKKSFIFAGDKKKSWHKFSTWEEIIGRHMLMSKPADETSHRICRTLFTHTPETVGNVGSAGRLSQRDEEPCRKDSSAPCSGHPFGEIPVGDPVHFYDDRDDFRRILSDPTQSRPATTQIWPELGPASQSSCVVTRQRCQ
jgi:hypothetical protein